MKIIHVSVIYKVGILVADTARVNNLGSHVIRKPFRFILAILNLGFGLDGRAKGNGPRKIDARQLDKRRQPLRLRYPMAIR